MRVALVRWRAEQDGELTSFVPDVDLDQLDSWGVIDLRGSGQKHQASADGVALLVAPNHTGPVPGALVDLGDDHQSRLGTTVGRALANRLGLNLVEATPGRIAAELLTLHASADDDSKPNPLVGERRFPRSKTDQRRRVRVWCAGVLLYDELGAHVDEEMAYYAETFPTAGALTSSQDLPWDSSSDPFTVASGGAYAMPGSAGDAYQRMATAHSSADHFAEIVAQLGDDSLLTWVGPIIRAETSNAASRSYGAQIRAREFDLFAYSSGLSGAVLSFGSTSLPLDTDFTARLEGDGSTIRLYINGSLAGSTTNSSYSGVHAGISASDWTTPDNARIYSFATALIGEEPGGGGTTVEGEATATLGALTGAATGVRSTAGTGTSSLGGLTGAATGVATVVGEASSSLGALSATATGTATTPPVEGTATANLGALTGTASGTTTVVGTATSTLGGLTGAATGTVQGVVNGQASANLGGLTGTATGVRATAGTAAATLGGLTGAADGQPTVVGEAAANLGGLTGAATGVATVVGQAAAHLGGLDGHAVGEGATTVVGEATAALGGLTATGTGTRTVTGAATAALGVLTGAAVVVTADPNPLSVTIRETGHRVVVRESRRRIYITR